MRSGNEMDDSLVGMWILDQFRLMKALGIGGMGKVYLAEQPSMDRHAAVKILRATKSLSDEERQRFRQEARAASRLTHPNIITVYNFGELSDHSLFLAMEYVEGVSLRDLLEYGPLPIMRAVNLIYQCAAALGCAHTKRVVHRDFKPDNVMVTRLLGRDHIKVLDFGIALLLEDVRSTQPGIILGTPEYISPEQVMGGDATSFSDQYALGLVFYEMLTGQPPFHATSRISYLHMHQHVMPPHPSKVRPEPGMSLLDPIVLRMVAKPPEDRFASMEKLQEALDAVADKVLHAVKGEKKRKTLPPVEQRLRRLPSVTPDAESSRVLMLGPEGVVEKSQWETLRRKQILLQAQCTQPEDLVNHTGSRPPDSWVLNLGLDDWQATWRRWSNLGIQSNKTLVCIDTSIHSPDVVPLAKIFGHLMIGAFPLDSMALAMVLHWMRHFDRGTIENLVSDQAIQVLQVSSSKYRYAYVDSLLEDLKAEGIRSSVQQAIKELAEEMIMNALFHASVDSEGRRRKGRPELGSVVTLPHGKEATLRWVIGERCIAVSIKDRFGSLSTQEIFSYITTPTAQPKPRSANGGAGLGLQIMTRSASHLLFFITPGRSCELVALVEREVRPDFPRGRSLCVLSRQEADEMTIGDRLVLVKQQHEKVCYLKLRGEINETSSLGAVFSQSGQVRLDLSEISGINSSGIHAWLEAYRRRNSSLQLVLERCALAMVRQFNMVPTLASTGTIESICAPYFCPFCCIESMEILGTDEIEGTEPPARTCQRCARDMRFEEMPDWYFAFLGG